MPTRYWTYLQECLRSGEFGSVRLGMTRQEVRACLGEPDDMGGGSRKHPVPCIWKYGEVELHFEPFTPSGELFLIYWDDAQGNSIAFRESGSQIHSEADEI